MSQTSWTWIVQKYCDPISLEFVTMEFENRCIMKFKNWCCFQSNLCQWNICPLARLIGASITKWLDRTLDRIHVNARIVTFLVNNPRALYFLNVYARFLILRWRPSSRFASTSTMSASWQGTVANLTSSSLMAFRGIFYLLLITF